MCLRFRDELYKGERLLLRGIMREFPDTCGSHFRYTSTVLVATTMELTVTVLLQLVGHEMRWFRKR